MSACRVKDARLVMGDINTIERTRCIGRCVRGDGQCRLAENMSERIDAIEETVVGRGLCGRDCLGTVRRDGADW